MAAAPMTRRQRVVLFLPIVVVLIAFLAAARWMHAVFGQQVLSWVGTAMVIFVVSYAVFWSIRVHRGLDEVEKAGKLFSMHWGAVAGFMTFSLFFSLPPVRDFEVDFIRAAARDPGADPKVIGLAIAFSACGVAIMQSIATLVMSAIWRKRMR